MEEIRGTEALEREILDDSSRKAERIGRKAREDADRIRSRAAEELAAKTAELARKYAEKRELAERERASRLPLERTRLKAAFAQAALSEAVRDYLGGLDGDSVGAWCAARLAERAFLFAGSKVRLRHRGVSPASLEATRKALSGAAELSAEADPGLARRGMAAADEAGSLRVTLTEAQMEEILLGRERGLLAAALLPSEFGPGRREAGKP